MALNAVMLERGTRHPVPLPNENFLYHCSGVKFELKPTATPSGDYPGSGITPKSASGTAFISNQRIVYLPATTTHETSMQPASTPGTLNSFTAQHTSLQNIKFVQPIFGANKFEAQVVNLDGLFGGSGMIVLAFKEGGGFDFAAIARKLAERFGESGEVPPHEEELPGYDAPPPAGSSSSQPTGGLPGYPSDAPPGYEQ
ncbi:hypothetical protein GGF37_006571 [Kickxella alabastrina]|nr:hypothetical protein GGF37_006571 [Kickxella alabastrina]